MTMFHRNNDALQNQYAFYQYGNCIRHIDTTDNSTFIAMPIWFRFCHQTLHIIRLFWVCQDYTLLGLWLLSVYFDVSKFHSFKLFTYPFHIILSEVYLAYRRNMCDTQSPLVWHCFELYDSSVYYRSVNIIR